MEMGTVKRSEIGAELDGDGDARVLQVELTSPEDVQSAEQYRAPGDDARPVNGTRVIVLSIGPASKVAIASIDLPPADDLAEGEREIYSTDGADRLATLRLKADGSIVLNGGSDNAVQFTAMQAAFDQLKADHDALVNTYNAHVHITTATVGLAPPAGTIGILAPTLSTGTPSTADMSGA